MRGERPVNALNRFVKELNRRKVTRTAVAYAAVAFLIVQVVSAVFPSLPLPDWADTMVTVLLALGFPIALTLAWALEITPQGVRGELTADEAEAAAAAKELRVDSVAVLPFDNLSADPENEYFSDGITEDVIASIARIRGIRVLARPSVLRYKGERRPVDEIARELGVATLVTGSVRRSDGRLRVVVQVLDARDESHRWSETYDRMLGDVFSIQGEIAEHVASAVRRELSASERASISTRGTSDSEAYDLYLRARYLWNQREPAAVAQSVDFFRRAVERDARFAQAHAGLADAHLVLGMYGARAPVDVYPAARDAAGKALALEPTLGEAMAADACVTALYEWSWRAAGEKFQRAIDLAPSYATARQWHAMTALTPTGRFAEALAALDRAQELDPASPAIATSKGIVHYYARDFSRARETLGAVIRAHASFGLAHHFLGLCHQAEGRAAEALESAQAAVRHSGASAETLAAQGAALAACGRVAEAEGVLADLKGREAHGFVSPVLFAQVLLGLGRRDGALTELERALAAKATDLAWLGVRPSYRPLDGDARFEAIRGRVGLTKP
jgi:serine/threonine-protein kinase